MSIDGMAVMGVVIIAIFFGTGLYVLDKHPKISFPLMAFGVVVGLSMALVPTASYGEPIHGDAEEVTTNGIVSLRSDSNTSYTTYGAFFIIGYAHTEAEEKDYYILYVKDEDGDIKKVRLPANEYSLRLTDSEAPCIKQKQYTVYKESYFSNTFPRINLGKQISKKIIVVPTNTIKVENAFEAQ